MATHLKEKPAGKHDACFLPRVGHATGNVQVHEMAWAALPGRGDTGMAQAEDVRSVKRNKAGFRHSDLNVRPDMPLGEIAGLLREADRDVAAVTSDGTANGVFLGLIGVSDFYLGRHSRDLPAQARMRPAADRQAHRHPGGP